MRFFNFLSAVLAIGSGLRAGAASFRQEWDKMPDAKFYEFEISEAAQFEGDHLLRQGKVSETLVETDLRPGVYFFRLRAIESGGRVGKWSTANRVVVKGQSSGFRSPKKNDRIEIPTPNTPVFFEWTTVEGATEYLLRLTSKDGKVQSQISQTTATSIKGLSPGHYQARVTAQIKGEPVSQSDALPFEIASFESPKPRFLEPQEGDILTSFEMSRVRWVRGVPGKKSEVSVLRLDKNPGVISRDFVEGRTQSHLPALSAGRYQITIKDFINDTEESVERSVTTSVEDDPMGYHSKYLGATWRLFNAGVDFGWEGHKNDATQPFAVAKTPRADLQTRVQSKVWGKYGAEVNLGFHQSESNPPSQTGSSSTGTIAVKAGATYRWEGWGATKPVLFKALGTLRQFRQFNSLSNAGNSNRRMENFRLFGVAAGAELRWGGWNSRYDLLAEATLDFPIFAGGTVYGRGSPLSIIPNLEVQAFVRRKIGDEWRFLLGFALSLEKYTISEPGATYDTRQERASFGPRIGLEWDL